MDPRSSDVCAIGVRSGSLDIHTTITGISVIYICK